MTGAAARRWPPNDGPLGDLVRSTDWAATPLGPIERWPSILRSTVCTVLDSHFPQNLLWGDALVQVYNGAFAAMIGARHPASFGRCAQQDWPELWHDIGPRITEVLRTGRAAFADTDPHVIVTDGVAEERHFTYSWSPVRDEDGAVVGVLTTVIETSAAVRDRRQRERRLSEALGTVERLRAAFDQAPAIMSILEGPSHRFVTANAEFRRFVGGRDVLGLTAREALPELIDQGYQSLLDDVYRSGTPHVATDAPIRLRRGSGLELEARWLDFVNQPLLDADGTITGILAVGVDVTDRHRAMQSLRDAEELARMALEGAELGIWRHDYRTDVVQLDALARAHHGIEADAATFAAVLARVEPDDVAALRAVGAAAIDPRRRGPLAAEYRVIMPDGTVRWIAVSGRVHFEVVDGVERAVRGAGTSQDVTRRRLADDRLRRSELEFRDLFDLSAVGVAQAEPASGRFVRVNRRMCEITGHDEAALLSMRVLDLTHPDDRARELEVVAPLQRGEADRWEIEKRYVRADGRTIWVNVVGRFLTDDSGRPYRTIASVVDITERKRAEDALRESETRLRLATDAVDMGAFDWSLETGVAWWSPRMRELFGYGPDEPLVREQLAAHVHPDDRERHARTFAAALDPAHGGHYACEYRIVVGPTIRWIDNNAKVFFEERGGRRVAVRLIGVVVDVTAKRELIDALREADRRKDEYLVTLAHELRNPLAPIRTSLALFDREPLSDRGRQALAMSGRQLTQLTRLVDDLLEIARVTRGKIDLRPEPLELRAVLEQVLEGVAQSSDDRTDRAARIVLDMPARGLRIVADPVRVAQIVENLLTNACKYSEPGSRIVVRVRDDADGVSISVQDEGIGIAPEHQPRIFDLFSQIDTAIDRSRGGLGVGLALVRRLAELHGGTVSVVSAGLGRGATFTVRLPHRVAQRETASI